MIITVAGIGYVGLSIAVLLAQNHEVIAITTTKTKADKINRFISPLQDDEINRFFNEARSGNRKLNLRATTKQEDSLATAELVIIATPTDYDKENNSFDTSSVEDVIQQTLMINPNVPIIIKSTVPIGYTLSLLKKYNVENILYSPEFLRETNALYDNLHPSRIVVGASDSQKKLALLFANLLLEGVKTEEIKSGQPSQKIKLLITNHTEAEAIKLFANTYLALRVSFFNELDTFAENKGLDVRQIIEGVSLDPRIGLFYNNPSFGYGGYCLPKDTKQLLIEYNDIPQAIIKAVVKSNDVRKNYVANNIIRKNPKIVGIYRLIMKTNSDNFRSSAIHEIMQKIYNHGITVIVYEPLLDNGSKFFAATIVNDLNLFKEKSDVILANRLDTHDLADVEGKVYTRDLFHRD